MGNRKITTQPVGGPHSPTPVADSEILYMVMRFMDWSAIDVTGIGYLYGFPTHLATPGDDEDQPCGFMPLFKTLEQAESWAGDGTYKIVPVMTRKPDGS
jgi:hypothetical protein